MRYRFVVVSLVVALLCLGLLPLAYRMYVIRAISTMRTSGLNVLMAEDPNLLFSSIRSRLSRPTGIRLLEIEPGPHVGLVKLNGQVKVRVLDRTYLTQGGLVSPHPTSGDEPNVFEVMKIFVLDGEQAGLSGWVWIRDLTFVTALF